MIKVFIVEDHEMYVEGLALLLKKQPDIDVPGTAGNGAAFVNGAGVDINGGILFS